MTKLDKGTVIAAALELLNEVGMDSLTTRKLAERLKVQQPALYWHFQNKRALLDALAEAMLAERHTRSLPEENEDWRVFLKENALSFRTALLSYRDGARIHAGTRPTEPNFGTAETQIRFLCAEGFCPKRAVWALRAVSHYVVGSVLEQQASDADE
ncbi:TPA: tetracycline resistance transcriptional repressor TetR(G), partial [Pseudomonas aeruginosa]|nr:tetracycline resistance transcriptional repressor TetR(G) [Salmonella enterica subsp. enterica serovar Typhimurium]HBO0421164.1 tetracycline resistance transcriptional repressor TetR(G) [Pseudomonas aeruginosa]HCF4728088.1 tetracycline resistance transcriptional repressor TetR(G) [Pseudomonas aeruginosa]